MGALFATLDTSLSDRVDELIRSHKSEQPLLHCSPTPTAIAELIRRNDGLEEAVRELAREIEDLAAARLSS